MKLPALSRSVAWSFGFGRPFDTRRKRSRDSIGALAPRIGAFKRSPQPTNPVEPRMGGDPIVRFSAVGEPSAERHVQDDDRLD
jgi:hypothetical protein